MWDNTLIAKAIENTPANYSRPIRVPTLEATLHGRDYDSYISSSAAASSGRDKASAGARAAGALNRPRGSPTPRPHLARPPTPHRVLALHPPKKCSPLRPGSPTRARAMAPQRRATLTPFVRTGGLPPSTRSTARSYGRWSSTLLIPPLMTVLLLLLLLLMMMLMKLQMQPPSRLFRRQ